MNEFEFDSAIFHKERVRYAGKEEWLVRGGRALFDKLPQAFAGIEQISVIGWGSQAPAQAQNLRDSLAVAGSDIRVVVGLREGSSSRSAAEEAGFTAENGTLQEMYRAIAEGDLVLLLISDGAQAEHYKKVFAHLKDGATLGLSHGFLVGLVRQQGDHFPKNINVIGVCPKGMGPSVRRLYVQGAATEGAGINTSFAIEQDINGRATDYALGWSIALGAPFSFMTSLTMEYRSDIFGERGILLGAVHGIVERLYQYKRDTGATPDEAFTQTVESLTGTISPTISHHGILGLYNKLTAEQQQRFNRLYALAYQPIRALLREIYEEVASGNEIRSVIMRTNRLPTEPMDTIDKTPMWEVGERVRAARTGDPPPLDAHTAAVYVATMMAQIDLLIEHGHVYSEIVNESVIEAVDSLNPYMHHRGVAFMIDNCSTTARLGARKWAPRFDYALYQSVLPYIERGDIDISHITRLTNHPAHEILRVLADYRPPIDIAFTE